MKMFKREKIIDFFFMREKIRKTSFQLNISMNIHQNLLFKRFTHKKPHNTIFLVKMSE